MSRVRFFRKRYLVAALVGSATVVTGVAWAATFTNPTMISILDAGTKPVQASPYPSGIPVSGLTGSITDVNVTLTGLTHSAPDDIDVLVTSPGGGKVIVMSDAGDGLPVSQAINLIFDDIASSSLPNNTQLGAGSYKPTNHGSSYPDDPFCEGEPDPEVFPGTAPAPPYAGTLAAFNGQAPNGTWNLYVTDDCAGATGTIATGWTVDVTAGGPTAVGVLGLTSRPLGTAVRIRWSTTAETQIAGFNIYRAATKLNRRLIPTRHPGASRGGVYSLIDRAVRRGGTYTYRLQVIGSNGRKAWFGATSIRLAS